MSKEIKDISKSIIHELHKLIDTIEDSININNNQLQEYQDNPNDSNEKRLQKQETWYDKMFEKYMKIDKMIQSKELFEYLFCQFQIRSENFFNEWKQKNEILRNKLDSFLVNEIMKTEKELKEKKFTEEYEIINYEEYVLNKEKLQRKQEEKKTIKDIEKRNKHVEGKLTKDEMIKIEKEIGRYVSHKIFDSDIHKWSKNDSQLFQKIQNQSHLIFIIETIDEKKFGCYISSQINEKGISIGDPNAFIFRFNNNSIEKYPIRESRNAIKICNDEDDELFIVGCEKYLFGIFGDIVIKKKDKKNDCNCLQKSFDYHGKINALLRREGSFSIKNISIFETLKKSEWEKTNENSVKYLKQLEEWTDLKCGEVIFNSSIDDWSIGNSILNNKINGKSKLTFIIENEDNEIFGYYFNAHIVIDEYEKWMEADEKSFEFNLCSKNKRLERAMKFEIKDSTLGGIAFYAESKKELIYLGNIFLFKENCKNESYCIQHNNDFNYYGIEKALCGKAGFTIDDLFTIKKLYVIQME